MRHGVAAIRLRGGSRIQRQGGLAICLRALIDQSYPPDLFEIIVVDNGANPRIGEVVGEESGIRLIAEDTPGSYAARNAAIAAARGDVFAFIDADIEADPNWLYEGVSAIDTDPKFGLVGGAVEFSFADPGRPSLAELTDSLIHFDQEKYVEIFHYSGAGNLFTRRDVFDRVGLFNPGLRSGGDREWGNRVHQKGLTLKYVPSAKVYHPARTSLAELIVKARRVSGRQKLEMGSVAPLKNSCSTGRQLFAGSCRRFLRSRMPGGGTKGGLLALPWLLARFIC